MFVEKIIYIRIHCLITIFSSSSQYQGTTNQRLNYFYTYFVSKDNVALLASSFPAHFICEVSDKVQSWTTKKKCSSGLMTLRCYNIFSLLRAQIIRAQKKKNIYFKSKFSYKFAIFFNNWCVDCLIFKNQYFYFVCIFRKFIAKHDVSLWHCMQYFSILTNYYNFKQLVLR